MQNPIETSVNCSDTKESKTTAAFNSPKKSARILQVEEPFQLLAAQSESDSVIPIQRILNPGFDPVSSALQTQCKIQNPKQPMNEEVNSPPRLLTPTNRLTSTKRRSTGSQKLGSQVEKRNQRERNRVHTVNQAFHALRSYLPALKTSTKRVSKLKILKSAINYLNVLTDQIEGIIDNIHSPVSTNASSGGSPNYIPATTSPNISTILTGTSLSQATHSDFQPNSALFAHSLPPTLSGQTNFFGLNYQNIASYVANLHN